MRDHRHGRKTARIDYDGAVWVIRRSSLLIVAAFALIVQNAARGSVTEVGSYDQIGRFLVDATAPPPDSFARDATTIAALPPMPHPPGGAPSSALGMLASIPIAGIIAGIGQEMAMMAYAKSMQAYSERAAEIGKEYVRAGTLQHVTFRHPWSRIDVTRMQSAVIQKPDTGETIYLDLARHVYRVARSATATSGDTYVVSDADETTAPAIANGATTTSTGTRIISDVATHGYHTTAAFTTASTLGRCTAGAHDVDETEYDSTLPDPQNTSAPAMTPAQIVSDACKPLSSSAHNEPGHLYVFRATTLTNTAVGTVTIVTERANIRNGSAADTSQFDIPPGFTEEKLP